MRFWDMRRLKQEKSANLIRLDSATVAQSHVEAFGAGVIVDEPDLRSLPIEGHESYRRYSTSLKLRRAI